MKRIKNKILTGIVCLAVLAGIAIPVSILEKQNKNVSASQIAFAYEDEDYKFEAHFIDVGQADSTLIICDGEAMLIDGGTNESGDMIVDYIKQQGVLNLNYMVGTHPHEDHIGGLDTIMDDIDTKMLIIPYLEYDTESFKDVLVTAKQHNVEMVYPNVGDIYYLGEAIITVLAPDKDGYTDTNNYSIVLRIDYIDTSFLMTGDAEIESEYDMLENDLNLQVDVLKVGHHGSDTSTSEGFIKALCPDYAVISVGCKNPYGHPSLQTLNRLQSMDVIHYRTDELGTVILYSDGKNIYNNIDTQETAIDGTQKKYILNKNTKKFHLPDCRAVGEMSEKNKLYTKESKEKLKQLGYSPCGICTP